MQNRSYIYQTKDQKTNAELGGEMVGIFSSMIDGRVSMMEFMRELECLK